MSEGENVAGACVLPARKILRILETQVPVPGTMLYRDICYSYLVLVICTVDSSWGAKGKGRWSALHRFLRSSTHVTSMRILCFAAMEHQVPGTFTNKNVHHTWYNTYRYNLHTWYCSALDVVVPGLHYNQYCCSCCFW